MRKAIQHCSQHPAREKAKRIFGYTQSGQEVGAIEVGFLISDRKQGQAGGYTGFILIRE